MGLVILYISIFELLSQGHSLHPAERGNNQNNIPENLVWGVKNGDVDVVKEEIKKLGNINDEILGGKSALHYAADYGQLEVIQCLIEHGADVNLQDKYGITPLLAAIYEGHADAVKLLLEKGAKKDGKAPDGQSYLELAETDELKSLLM